MLAYWDADLNKSVDFFPNPICILLAVCTSTISVCIAIYANKILFKLKKKYQINFDFVSCYLHMKFPIHSC